MIDNKSIAIVFFTKQMILGEKIEARLCGVGTVEYSIGFHETHEKTLK